MASDDEDNQATALADKSERDILLSKLPPHIQGLNSEDIFVYLLSNNEEMHIRAFGKFLDDSFETRNSLDSGLLPTS